MAIASPSKFRYAGKPGNILVHRPTIIFFNHPHLAQSTSRLVYHLCPSSFLIHQSARQNLSMINHLRRQLSKPGVGVVTEDHDAGIGDQLVVKSFS
jgi:hypothetical protein